MQWPPGVIDVPTLFPGLRIEFHFDAYIQKVLRPKWQLGLSKLKTHIEIRDFIEDSIHEITNKTIQINQEFLRELKVSTNRLDMAIQFITNNVLEAKIKSEAFVHFAVDKELEVYFEKARELSRFRPVLAAPRALVEQVLSSMESDAPTLESFKAYASTLGLSSLWPIYALWASSRRGEAEDIFMHPPLPRVFGSPSCVRNAIERRCDPSKLVINKPKALTLDSCVLAGQGKLAWREGDGWRMYDAINAHLVASLPGLVGYVWTLDPVRMRCGIYKRAGLVIEFELPKEEHVVNWIDCQRDPEGALVLLWGHINALTGSLVSQNSCAFDEDALISDKTLEFLDSHVDLPDRRKAGTRIDWRDHGNLLSVHHIVTEDPNKDRKWLHNFDIVYGNHLLMTLTTDARPIEALFGCPTEMVLFSPLSSKALQHWKLESSGYVLASAIEVPPLPSGRWASVVVL